MMKQVTINPPSFLRFHQGSGQSIVLQYDEKDEEKVNEWLKDCFIDALNLIELAKPETKPTEPQPNNVINFPQGRVVPDTDDDFKPALCLTCEKFPIAHRSGLCNACHEKAKETLDSLPDTEETNTENNEENNV